VVKLMFFAGLTVREVGEVLGVADRTVMRSWAFARAWLYQELREVVEPATGPGG
jgi:DNA-directed RNA polymerase specialized sigma subunit